ncbi:MAG: precorrin-6A reductase [Muricomes sp.]
MDTGKKCVLLFAGTSEGREIAEYLSNLPVVTYVSTATEYGMECVENIPGIRVICGRMDEEEIGGFIEEHEIDLVIDATHPFARIVTRNIQNACLTYQKEYLRCLRDKTDSAPGEIYENTVIVESVAEAVEYLKTQTGKIFIATGSKELKLYTEIEDYKERCYARVLSSKEAVEESMNLGFKGAHLIAMQGPFSRELNIAMLRHTNTQYFVTKESGKAGGFEEKLEAAKELGVTLVVIGRPEETGSSIEEVKQYIQNSLKMECKRD